MVAVPCVAAPVTLNTVPSARPSASVAVRLPVIAVSSFPVPLVPPVTLVGSFTAVAVNVTAVGFINDPGGTGASSTTSFNPSPTMVPN